MHPLKITPNWAHKEKQHLSLPTPEPLKQQDGLRVMDQGSQKDMNSNINTQSEKHMPQNINLAKPTMFTTTMQMPEHYYYDPTTTTQKEGSTVLPDVVYDFFGQPHSLSCLCFKEILLEPFVAQLPSSNNKSGKLRERNGC